MRGLRAALPLGIVWLVACRASGSDAREANTMAVAGGAARTLPPPSMSGQTSLEDAMARRRSVREFTADTLQERSVSQLFWAAQGVTDPEGLRTAPSAGALYPLELYVALSSGLYHYSPRGHRVELLVGKDLRAELSRAAYGQEAVADAPAVFAITAVVARTAAKYGGRAERYVTLEAGHAAQNMLLEATSLGLGAVPVGAFDDRRVHEVLHLSPGEEALYLIPVGHPRR